MISQFVAAIRHIDPEITDIEVADSLWLALQIRKAVGAPELDEETQSHNDATLSEELSKPLPKDRRNLTSEPTSSKPSVSTPKPQSPKIGLYPDSSQGGSASQLLRALPFHSPAATALPGSLDIARVLRPFRRRVRQRGTTVLNEEATAKRIAEEDIWVPVLDNALTRWLEVALVVDIGKSMTIWRQTITELHRLLARHGAFRDVRLWELDSNDGGLVRLYAGLGVGVQHRQPRSELELIDISSRRLVLIVTDCVSAAWHSGVATDILAKWGQYNPVTLLQVLPRRLWSRTALGMATSVRLHAATPGTANRQLHVQSTQHWDDEEALPTIPIPIVTLEPKSLAAWARVIARAEDVWIPGFELVILSPIAEKQEQDEYTLYEEALSVKLSAAERVQRFRANASPPAWRLAGLLATLPITLPIVRLVQQAMFHEPQQVHVAEVFLSGLLEIAPAHDDALEPDEVQFDFVNGVREILLNSLPPNDSSRILTEISALITSKFAHPLDFGALLANPLSKEGMVIDKENRPFALMGAGALRRFGGDYVTLANWLTEESRNVDEEGVQTELDASVYVFERSDEQNLPIRSPELPEQADDKKTEKVEHINPPQLWNVPYRRNPFFTGREETLNQLYQALHSESAVALSQPQGISGLGGIGKTQTVLEYAYRHRVEYSAVLWMQADSIRALTTSFVEIAHLLGLPERNEQDEGVIVEAVNRWLRLHTAWLLIIENADDLSIAEPFLPKVGSGHILFTTRTHALGGIAQRLGLQQMDPETGALLLLRRAGTLPIRATLDQATSDDIRVAREISQELGGLPLALDQAGAYIKEAPSTLSEYLELYQTRRQDLLQMRGSFNQDYPASVATTWSLSFEKVARSNPAAAELLCFCAFLAPDAIPETIITQGAPHLGDVLFPIVTNPVQLDEIFKEGLRYSLFQRTTDTFYIHRLVKAVLQDTMSTEVAKHWKQRTVAAVNAASPNVRDVEQWDACELWLPHALACATWIEQEQITSPDASHLLDQAGFYLNEHARYTEAEPLLVRALSIRQQQLGATHPDIAQSLNNLAELYKYQGKYSGAEPLLVRALAIREQQLGAQHPDTASSLNSLAELYRRQGRANEAKALQQRALALHEQQQGAIHPDTDQERAMEKQPALFDVCIVCALPEEVRAFLEVAKLHCEDVIEERISPRYHYSYCFALLKNNKDESLNLHISWLPHYGPQEMTLHLTHVLEEYRPRIVMMTGICVGDAQSVRLGDLVVAERNFTYDNGEFTIGEDGRRFHRHDTLTNQLDSKILRFLRLFNDWKPLIAALERPPSFPEQHTIACHIKAMASGSAVRADNPFRDVQFSVRDTVAIDTEGAAFSLVMSRYPQIPWLIVKSVSDYIDRTKSGVYNDYAARVSALYALSFIQAFVTNERLPRSVRSGVSFPEVWNVFHRRTPFFTGRDHVLQQLSDGFRLESEAEIVSPQALTGLAGMGKTQTAVEFAYRFRGNYRAVLWIRAETQENLLADFKTIASLLKLPQEHLRDRASLIQMMQEWFISQKDWLLIFDDADNLALIEPFLPRAAWGHVLLTRRSRSAIGLARVLALEPLEPEAGALCILRRAGILAWNESLQDAPEASADAARQLAQLMDGFPLALEQAGAYMNDTESGVRRYLHLYQQYRTEVQQLHHGAVPDYTESVATAWRISRSMVEQSNPAAFDLLRLCAYLAPEAIPEELLTNGASVLGPVLGPVAANPIVLDQSINLLRKYSLLNREVDRETDLTRLFIHRIIQEILLDEMDRPTQQMWAGRAVRAVALAIPTIPWAILHAHVRHCLQLIEQWNLDFPEAELLQRHMKEAEAH